MEPDPDTSLSGPAPAKLAASAVAALAEVEDARFEALADVLPTMLWITVPDVGVEYFSPRWARFTGRSVEQLKGKGYMDLVHPDDVPMLRDTTADDFAKGTGSMVFRLRRADGVYRWMEAFGTTVRDDAGQILRFVGGTNDITERREQEEAAREASAQLQSALEIAHLGRFVFYLREERLDVDERLKHIFGFGSGTQTEHPTPQDFLARIHPDDLRIIEDGMAQAATGPDYAVEYRAFRSGPAGDEEIWVAARGRVEHDDAGPVRMIGVVEDITLRKQEETLRALTQRRETLGALVGGIAHDFNNLLGAISSNARLAELETARGADPRESLEEIRRGIDLAAELVRRMLDYSRDGEGERKRLVLATIVEQAISLVRPALPQQVHVRSEFPDLPLVVLGDGTQLHQVIVNLLTNAGQALEGAASGSITVTVEAAGDAARLVVCDDGPGMDPTVARRAFEPFFTTKPAGGGTGLGLSTVRTIIRDHGGSIALRTAPGEGATFTIELPLAPSEADAGSPGHATMPSAQAAADAERDLVVLYVDDETALTRLAARALPLEGWIARTFTDPLEARAAFEAEPDGFQVVVTDLSMPGCTGLELIAALRAVRPALPVILTSGFLTADDRAAAAAQGVDAILPKPCTIDELVSTIRRLADAGE